MKALTLAFLAVVGAGLADVMEPWPLKMLLDYVIGNKAAPAWLTNLAQTTFGTGKAALLNLAVLAVLLIAVVGAVEFVL
ncbi:MAG: hypothetical protein U0Y68_25435 [Blastocatellia bacterium]